MKPVPATENRALDLLVKLPPTPGNKDVSRREAREQTRDSIEEGVQSHIPHLTPNVEDDIRVRSNSKPLTNRPPIRPRKPLPIGAVMQHPNLGGKSQFTIALRAVSSKRGERGCDADDVVDHRQLAVDRCTVTVNFSEVADHQRNPVHLRGDRSHRRPEQQIVGADHADVSPLNDPRSQADPRHRPRPNGRREPAGGRKRRPYPPTQGRPCEEARGSEPPSQWSPRVFVHGEAVAPMNSGRAP